MSSTSKIITEKKCSHIRLHTTTKNSKSFIKYRIREIEENDLKGGGVLEVLENLAPVGELDRTAAINVLQQIKSNPLHKVFVAVQDEADNQGLVVGATTLLVEPKFIFSGARFGHVEDVVVRKEYEGTGIGSKLVRHATEVAAKMGCMKTVLYCSDERMSFYERLGYSYRDNCMEIQHK
jgi:glucosamine-phosphate N-acetyltransferase